MSDITPNTDPFLQNPYPNDAIDIKDLLNVLLGAKWTITVVMGFAGAISLAVALSLPNLYNASAVLAPAETTSGGLSGVMQEYSGLASLAGVSLPGRNRGGRTQLALQLMKSRAFTANFIERRNILPELMAAESWDRSSGKVLFDPDSYDAATKEWVRNVKSPRAAKPSAQEAYKAFTDILSVSEDKDTGYVYVSIEHLSPNVAARWVNWLVEDVNLAVKTQDVLEAERSIKYLKQQVANTSVADLQAVFFTLIQSQTETVMLAEVRPQYVFKTIDPAVPPEQKSGPQRILICILGTLLGSILAMGIVLVRHYSKSDAERQISDT